MTPVRALIEEGRRFLVEADPKDLHIVLTMPTLVSGADAALHDKALGLSVGNETYEMRAILDDFSRDLDLDLHHLPLPRVAKLIGAKIEFRDPDRSYPNESYLRVHLVLRGLATEEDKESVMQEAESMIERAVKHWYNRTGGSGVFHEREQNIKVAVL